MRNLGLIRVPPRLRRTMMLNLDLIWRELPRHPSLSLSREQTLWRQYRTRQEQAARDELILSHLRLVVSAARHFGRSGMDWDDLIQEGCLALIEAIDRFDPRYGVSFRSYVHPAIFRWMMRVWGCQGAFLKTSMNWESVLFRFVKYRRQFRRKHGHLPRDQDVRRRLRLTAGEYRRFLDVLRAHRRPRQLSARISSPHGVALQRVAREEQREVIDQVLRSRFDERRLDIIRGRFGLDDRPVQSLQALGCSHGITRERVRQLEEEIILILKHPAQRKRLGILLPR